MAALQSALEDLFDSVDAWKASHAEEAERESSASEAVQRSLAKQVGLRRWRPGKWAVSSMWVLNRPWKGGGRVKPQRAGT